MRAIRTGARSTFETITELIRVPVLADERLAQGLPRRHLRRRGLLQADSLRISNTDGVLIHWTQASLDLLGFDTVVEDYAAARTSCASCGSAAG